MRKMIYEDKTTGEVTTSIDEHYVRMFIECLLQSGYYVKIEGDGAEIAVTYRRD